MLLLRSSRSTLTHSIQSSHSLLHRPHSTFLHQFLVSNMAPQDIQHNRPIVISGPSGTGKSTLIKRLFAAHPSKFGFSISHTTRQPRTGEVNGREYHFVSIADFISLKERGGFIETAEFSGNHYGTSVETVASVAAQERICILDIEMEGVKQIHRHETMGKTARFLFVSPPSREILAERLRGRGTDSEEAVNRRLEKAIVEMEYSKTEGVHDKVVVNDDLDRAYKEIEDWILQG